MLVVSTLLSFLSVASLVLRDLFCMEEGSSELALALTPVSFHGNTGDNSLTREETSLQRNRRKNEGWGGDRRGGEEITQQCLFSSFYITSEGVSTN